MCRERKVKKYLSKFFTGEIFVFCLARAGPSPSLPSPSVAKGLPTAQPTSNLPVLHVSQYRSAAIACLFKQQCLNQVVSIIPKPILCNGSLLDFNYTNILRPQIETKGNKTLNNRKKTYEG
jgi:hypothetical protein